VDVNTITEDASQPAVVTQSSATTSALSTTSFTPPGGSLILVLWGGNSTDPTVPSDPTINAVTGLTWRNLAINKRGVGAPVSGVDGQSSIWWARIPYGGIGAITVTVNNNAASGTRHAFMAVRVLLGAADLPIGANGIISDNATTVFPIASVTQGNFSAFYATFDDWNANGTPTANANTTAISAGSIGAPDISYGLFKRTTNNLPAGSTANMVTFSALGIAEAKISWVEILAAEDNYARPQIAPGGRSPGSRRRSWVPGEIPAAPAASPIAPDTTGSTVMTVGATTANVDITAAAVGAWCYAWVALGSASGTVTATGWQDVSAVINSDDTTLAHYALLRRQKQSGDTTFAFNWTSSAKGVLTWASWTGLDGTTPDEGAVLAINATTSRTAVPTTAATPTAADRWAATFFAVRTSNSLNKPISWTPDAATVERIDIDNNAAGSAAWMGVEIADSNGVVTQASHSYTAVHAPAAESHDASVLLFLIPSSGGGGAVNAPAESPTGVYTAQDANVASTASPDTPGGAGSAADTTVDASTTAQAASAAGAAQDPSGALTTSAVDAGATGVAADGTGSVGASPTTPAGTGTAADIAGVISTASPDTPSGAGSAGDGNSAVTVNPDTPGGTGTAFDATVSTASFVNALAEAASGAGTGQDALIAAASNPDTPIGAGSAPDASSALATSAGQAGATGTAADGTGSVGATPTAPSGAGRAGDGTTAATSSPDTPVGAGAAFDATVQTSGSANAPAEATQAAGAAQDPSTAVTVGAGAASATGAANDATGAVGVVPDTPTASGAAQDPTTASSAGGQTASSTGTAGQPAPDVQVGPAAASGTGTAYDATVAVYSVGVAVGAGQAFDATVLLVPSEVTLPRIDARVVVGAVMAVVASPGGPVPVIPGHYATVATTPASGPEPLPVVARQVSMVP
jgi:hypothetical protein